MPQIRDTSCQFWSNRPKCFHIKGIIETQNYIFH